MKDPSIRTLDAFGGFEVETHPQNSCILRDSTLISCTWNLFFDVKKTTTNGGYMWIWLSITSKRP